MISKCFLDINFSLLNVNSAGLAWKILINDTFCRILISLWLHVDIHTSYFCKIEPDHVWPRDWPNLHLVDNQLIKWILIVDSPSNTLLVWSYNTKQLICVFCRWKKLWIDIFDHIIFFTHFTYIYNHALIAFSSK